MSVIHSFKDHISGLQIMPKSWFYLSFWQSYEWLRVHTLEIANSGKTHRKFIYSPGWYKMQMP